MKKSFAYYPWYCPGSVLYSPAAVFFSTTYDVAEGTVKATYKTAKIATDLTVGTVKIAYKIGKYTFEVVAAPLSWPLINDDIESIGGMSPKEAIRQGKVKNSPYVVKGKRYVPMSVEEAQTYKETGSGFLVWE